ncbi:thioredoxin TrxA [Spartinivicinus ruber]|uniref:thioredoxin TrxA n=1 Tax=Spartinivicinus ruber TaxID=2683272 RepID=UPI0013D49388|nr:thioredoxin TrxA [Spartinivicinus ruber]
MSEHILNVTDENFDQEVLNAEGPVLVDYWAEWCGPCKMITPILDEIANEYKDRLKVCKLNIDDNEATPPKYGVRGIPTLMLFKNGNVEATKVGALSKTQLVAFLEGNL